MTAAEFANGMALLLLGLVLALLCVVVAVFIVVVVGASFAGVRDGIRRKSTDDVDDVEPYAPRFVELPCLDETPHAAHEWPSGRTSRWSCPGREVAS